MLLATLSTVLLFIFVLRNRNHSPREFPSVLLRYTLLQIILQQSSILKSEWSVGVDSFPENNSGCKVPYNCSVRTKWKEQQQLVDIDFVREGQH